MRRTCVGEKEKRRRNQLCGVVRNDGSREKRKQKEEINEKKGYLIKKVKKNIYY